MIDQKLPYIGKILVLGNFFCAVAAIVAILSVCSYRSAWGAAEEQPVGEQNASKIHTSSTPQTAVEVTLAVEVVGEGTVELDPAGGMYWIDTPVTLTAQPAPGWSFTGWQGDLVSKQNPLPVNMETDLALRATFIQALEQYSPLQDAYTDATSPQSILGEAEWLWLKTISPHLNTNLACNPQTYLWFQFAIPQTTKAIEEAVLSIPLEATGENLPMELELFGSPDITWSESSLHWDNQPALDSTPLALAGSTPPGSDILFFGATLAEYLTRHRGGVVSLVVRANCAGQTSPAAERMVRAREHTQSSGVELYYSYPSAITLTQAHATPAGETNPGWWSIVGAALLLIASACAIKWQAQRL